LVEDARGIEAIAKELFGENSGSAEAKAGVKAFHDTAESLKQAFNEAGGNIGTLEDWNIPQHHSQDRALAAGRDQWLQTLSDVDRAKAIATRKLPPADWARDAWVADKMARVNRDAYVKEDGALFDDAEMKSFLDAAWQTVATNGANKIEPGQATGFGARSSRNAEHRAIHYKDAQAWLDDVKQYGEKGIYQIMIDHVSRLSRDIALIKTLGPNPDRLFNLLADEVWQRDKLQNPTKGEALDKQRTWLDTLYNEVAGKHEPPASRRLANGFQAVRDWLIATRLGSAIITSLSDEGTLYLTARVNDLPLMQVARNELAAMNPANREELRLANRAGISLDTAIGYMNRFGQESLGPSFTRKMASATLRASGLLAITEARRRAFQTTMFDAIGHLTRTKDFAALDPHDSRMLKSTGLTEAEYRTWQLAKVEDWGHNETVLTPASIMHIPDADLAALSVTTGKTPSALRNDAMMRLLGHVIDEGNMAVIEPGARERAFTSGQFSRGTWSGELARSFFLFKSFPIAMIERHFYRGMGQETAGGKAVYLASLLAGTTLLGAVSQQIAELVAGRDPRNMNPIDGKGGGRFWVAALMKGGSLGIYGDFLFSNVTRHDNSVLASMLGPVFGEVESMLNVSQGNLVQWIMDKDTHAGAEVLRELKGLTPGASLWYTKSALDHLFFQQLQDYLSPGYAWKVENRARREFGQESWWGFAHPTPDRAPDLSKAWGTQ